MSNAATQSAADRAALNYVAKCVRDFDRRAVKFGSSLVDRAQSRASALDMAPESRAAVYPLAWALETGRASTAFETAVVAMDARKFAAAALAIAARGGSVNVSWEAWKAAVAA